jgi:hypothetical protein
MLGIQKEIYWVLKSLWQCILGFWPRALRHRTLFHTDNYVSWGTWLFSIFMAQPTRNRQHLPPQLFPGTRLHGARTKNKALKYIYIYFFFSFYLFMDRWASSVCRSRGPGSIPSTTRSSKKQGVWNGVHSTSWLQLRSYLKEKNSGSGLENRDYGRKGSATLTTRHPSILKHWH